MHKLHCNIKRHPMCESAIRRVSIIDNSIGAEFDHELNIAACKQSCAVISRRN